MVDDESTSGPRRRKPLWRRVGLAIGVIVVVLVLAVGALYVYPLGSDRLQHAQARELSFDQAEQAATTRVDDDTADAQVLPECRSILRVHPEKAAKAVLMLHGYTSCPKDYTQLAQLFYDRGYNVYAPRETHHGLRDVAESSEVSADGLVAYADESMDVVAGLGDEVGVIGLSGGSVLATWLAERRTESVAHLLLLSPFYRPDSSQAPPIALRPLTVLFGFRLLPDRTVGDTNFTLSGLGQYLRITANLDDEPDNPGLRSVAVAWSAVDPYIDQEKAVSIPTGLAEANDLKVATHEFGADANLPHNIVAPSTLGARTDEINQLYLDLYEG
ncbi:alpha/beta hydrolase [Kineosporia sp. J2-2]|uniref:Alpha/beta hydrolase n=1 Tax=Kineosporia corallincola TaxID=2835133 RepID=A0ABS5TP33_9ACTN|nr:alpha/beta hydrolase [Kineosporia corallincola]MBT0772864.1 alpha/beta hydrolase [Kineosporia corallincola]